MKCKYTIYLILFLLTVSIVTALDLCGDTLQTGQGCIMMTPTLSCSGNYSIYNETDFIITRNMTYYVGGGIYQFTFSEGSGNYLIQLCDNTTRDILVGFEDDNMSIAIIIALGIVTLIFFGLTIATDGESILKHLWFAMTIIMVSVVMFIGNVYAIEQNIIGEVTQVVFVSIAWLFTFVGLLMLGSFVITIYRNWREAGQESHLAHDMWKK